MDGARIFNAACFLNKPVRDLAAHADSVMFCLSKGLCAPVGSMLVGSGEAIERGRLYRKRLGGGMRQVGVLAAAGLIALEEMPHRLGEDHPTHGSWLENWRKYRACASIRRASRPTSLFSISPAPGSAFQRSPPG